MHSGALEPKFVSLLGRFRLTPEPQRQQRSSGAGVHLSKGRGQSLDFSEYRPYQPGDDLRTLDWKLYGRTDRLYTKLFVPEQEETVIFVIDRSASMQAKWTFLRGVVAGLATVALAQGDRVAVRFLTSLERSAPEGMMPVRGRNSLVRVLRQLDTVEAAGTCELDDAFRQLARRLKTRAHVIVISDFLQEGAGLAGLAQLHYRRHRLSCLQLLAPAEIEPEIELAPGVWELVNPEPEEPDPQRDVARLDLGPPAFVRYRHALAAHNAQLQAFARRTGAIFISAPSSLSLRSYFAENLRRGGLLA